MKREQDPQQEGHTREWADRARVEMNPRQDVSRDGSPRQSPSPDDHETRRDNHSRYREYDHDDKFY